MPHIRGHHLRDEYRTPEHAGEAELREAYHRGRRDEHYRHKSSPFLLCAAVCVCMAGAATLVLAAYKGSFAAGGGVMDRQIRLATSRPSVDPYAGPPRQEILRSQEVAEQGDWRRDPR